MNDKNKERVGFGVVLLIVLCIVAVFFVRANGQDISVEITSRTEYIPGDEGQVIGEVRYVISGEPATADCYASAYYPNKATLFFEQLMVETAFGTHYYNFSVPSEEGVYEYQTKCDIGDKNVTRSKAFHVSGLLGEVQQTVNERVEVISQGVSEAGLRETVANTWQLDTPLDMSIGIPICKICLVEDFNCSNVLGIVYANYAEGVPEEDFIQEGTSNLSYVSYGGDPTMLLSYEVQPADYSWVKQLDAGSGTWAEVAIDDTGQFLAAAEYNGYVWTSSDYGVDWTERTILPYGSWNSIASSANGSRIMATRYNTGSVYISDDYGSTWSVSNTGGTKLYDIDSSADGSFLVTVDRDGYLYTSDTYGVNWTEHVSLGTRSWVAAEISANGQHIIGFGSLSLTAISHDYGVTWDNVTGLPNPYWKNAAMSDDGSVIMVGEDHSVSGRVYLSQDYGNTWVLQSAAGSPLPTKIPYGSMSVAVSGDGNILAVAKYNIGNVYTSDNLGATWTQQPSDSGDWRWIRVALNNDGSRIVSPWTNGGYIWTGVIGIGNYFGMTTDDTWYVNEDFVFELLIEKMTGKNVLSIEFLNSTGAVIGGYVHSSLAGADNPVAPYMYIYPSWKYANGTYQKLTNTTTLLAENQTFGGLVNATIQIVRDNGRMRMSIGGNYDGAFQTDDGGLYLDSSAVVSDADFEGEYVSSIRLRQVVSDVGDMAYIDEWKLQVEGEDAYSINLDANKLTYYWYADPLIFTRGKNYNVECTVPYTVVGSSGSGELADMSQFVYINGDNKLRAAIVK